MLRFTARLITSVDMLKQALLMTRREAAPETRTVINEEPTRR